MAKNKIGIATLQNASNYGAVLQAYALQTFLKEQGNEVEIIDYYDAIAYGYYDYHILAKPVTIKSILAKIRYYKRNKVKYAIFDNFRKRFLELSKRLYQYEDLEKYAKKFDVVICGSDQIWNSKINKTSQKFYYLDFCNCKKISYAASCGNVDLLQENTEYIKEQLKKYKSLSVREKDLQRYLKDKLELPSRLVCDPVLLIDRKKWNKIEQKISVPKQFIFVYMLNNNDFMVETVKKMADKYNLPVINIGKNISKVHKNIKYLNEVSPQQFLYLFNYATYIFTNSFHGVAFSIIYNKHFLCFGNGSYDSRMLTLLEAMGISNKMITYKDNFDDCITKLNANYKNKQSLFVEESKNFLKEIE